MGKTKKLLSVFLAFLMVLSSVTVGLTAFAADEIKTYDGLDENHQALAAALQVDYVVDKNNYVKAATRDYVAMDNEEGDIAKAAEALYKCLQSTDSNQAYGRMVGVVRDKIKNAMGSDYNATAMNTAIGNLCGYGSISNYSSAGTSKFTVSQNINTILGEYTTAADVPDSADGKATAYIYVQTGSSSTGTTTMSTEPAAASMVAFTDFAKMFSADVIASAYDDLPEGALDNIDENGQKVIDAAKIVSEENIKKLVGENVSIEAAQAYLDGILVYKTKEYTDAITAIGAEVDGKAVSDFTLDTLATLKASLDSADKLYNSYVQVQKDAVKASHDKYDEYVKFYQDSFNYNKAPEYADVVKAVEKYADDSYEFTKEELPEVKALLDAADKKYKEFLGTPDYQAILDSKATYDKALANYTEAYEYYDWQDYKEVIAKFAKNFDSQRVLDIPKYAYMNGSTMTLVDDTEQNVLDTERNFVYLINFLFTKHSDDYKKIDQAIAKIIADLTPIMGAEAVEQKDVENIMLNYLNNGPVTSSQYAAYNKTIDVEYAYLFEYNSVDELPEAIKYNNARFNISYNRATLAFTSSRESVQSPTDSAAQGAFSLFAATFTEEFLNTDLDNCTFEELSLIRRKAVAALNGISAYREEEIAHFFGDALYPQAAALNEKCDALMAQIFNEKAEAIVEKYDGRDLTAAEARTFFEEAAGVDNVYSQLSDAVQAMETVAANKEKFDALKAEVKLIVDQADAEDFVKMVKAFEDKYPEKDLDMNIYDAFNADLGPVLDFYNQSSEGTKAMEDVVKAFEDLTALNEAMDAVFRAYRFEEFKEIAPEKLDSLYTGDLENAQVIEFSTFDIANIKQIMAEINKIYGDLSDEARIDEFVVNYMAVVSKLQERITLLTNPPEFKPYTVEYPENITQAQVQDIITRLDGVIAGDLIENLLGQPLDEAIDGLLNGLLTADIVNTLVKALYPMVSDALGSNASIASILKINVLPRTLASNITHYPAVKAALLAAGDDWNAVDWELCDWVSTKGAPVNSLDTFIDALGESLLGIVKLLQTLLNGKTLNALVLTIPGNQGYEKDILPLLELLGCDAENGLVTVDTFNAAMDDVQQELRYIIYPLLDRVKELLRENTVTDLFGIIANLSFVVSNDMLYTGFADLVSPLKAQVDLVKTLTDAGIDLTNLIGTINGFLGSTGITLPVLNWAEFAGIGTYHTDGASLRPSGVRNYIDATEPDVLVQLLYYVHDVIAANQEAILGLLGDSLSPEIKDIIVKALGQDKKTFTGALIQLLTPYDAPDYTWPAFEYAKTDVNYSAYTSAEVKDAVDKISSILNNVLALLLNGSLNDLIGGALYTGENVQALFSAIYGLLDNPTVATVFSLISVTDADGNKAALDISKDAVEDNLKSDFPKVAKAIRDAESISAAVINASDWEIETEEDFANAIAAIAAPVAPVLTALLAGKGMTVSIADGAVMLYGANGYNNAVKPLLDALTCDTLSPAEFNTQAKADNKNAILNVINPVLGLVKSIADNPLNAVIDIIPHISLFIDNNGIQTAVEQLLAPLNNIIGAIGSLLDADDVYVWLVDDLLSGLTGMELNWNNLQNQIIPILNDKLLGNIKINDELSISLKLNDIDWGKFAGCLDKNSTAFTTNASDSTVTIIDYIWGTVKANEATLRALLESLLGENYASVAQYIDKFLALDAEGIVKILVDLTKGLDASGYKADWSFLYRDYKETAVKLPAGVTAKDIENTVKTISEILNKVLELLLDGSLTDLIGTALYTDDLITMLANAIFALGENSTVNTILGVLGVDLSKDAIVELLSKDYPKVSKAVQEAESLGQLDTSDWKWNVKDRASFTKALATILRPFAPALNVLLNSGEINIAGVVDFKGSNGYENAVKPLLDALGCKTVSAAQYVADANKNSDSLILNIINPLLDLADEILANPVEKIEAILPQAANFIDKGGVQYAVENLLYPVTNLISPLVSVITDDTVFDFIIDLLGLDINWKNLHNDIIPMLNGILKDIEIEGKKISLVLPEINWAKLAGCGSLVSGGIKADVADTTVTLVDYVWRTVKLNEKAVKTLLADLLGDSYKDFAPYIDKLLAIDSSKLIKTVVDVIKNLDASSFKADWSFLYRNYSASSVVLPAGVTSADLTKTVEILTKALNNALDVLLDSSLVSLVGKTLYTDDLITTLAKTVYALGDDETFRTVLGVLGVDLSKDALAASLKKDYPAVAKAIQNSKSLSQLDTSKWNWNVKDKNSFAKALTAVLRPFAPALNVLLNSGELDIEGVVNFKGSNGYENAVKPLLDALGCNTVSAAQYAADAYRNADNLILNIINPLLSQVDAILADPVNKIASILPQAANFIDKGGVQYAVENLLYPVTNLISPVVKIFTNDSVFNVLIDLLGLDINWNNIQNEIIPMLNSSVLNGIEIGGKKLALTLPSINWRTLAGCGTLSGKSIKADANKELMVLLRYIFKALEANQAAVMSLVGNNATVNQIIKNVIKCGPDKVTQIVVNILLKMETVNNASWSFRDILPTAVEYTENLSKEDFVTVLEQIDPMINELLADFAGQSLNSLVTNLVYTNSIVNTLAELIYTNLEKLDIGVDINTILSMLDVDISTKAVAEAVKDHKSASNAIAKYSKWSDVKFDNINWGFKDGDRDGFVDALTAVLRPLFPVLRAVLSADDLIVLDSITIKGGNGYNTAIVPIAEALGIKESALVSVAAYASQADSDKLLTNILNPLLDRVEEILASPVSNLAEVLPNLAYFVANDGIYNAAVNLIKPVTNILDEIAPIYKLDLDLSMLKNLDLAGLVNSLLSSVKVGGKSLGIKLSNIDLMTLAGRGVLEEYQSVRTYNGSRMMAKRVAADKPAVLISVLRYIVSNLKTNLDAITGLLAGLDISEDILDVINTVLEALATEDVDAVIELLVDLLFNIKSGDIVLTPDNKTEPERFIPFIPGNFYWVYWVILAAIVVAVGIGLFFILRNKKKDDETENTEVR